MTLSWKKRAGLAVVASLPLVPVATTDAGATMPPPVPQPAPTTQYSASAMCSPALDAIDVSWDPTQSHFPLLRAERLPSSTTVKVRALGFYVKGKSAKNRKSLAQNGWNIEYFEVRSGGSVTLKEAVTGTTYSLSNVKGAISVSPIGNGQKLPDNITVDPKKGTVTLSTKVTEGSLYSAPGAPFVLQAPNKKVPESKRPETYKATGVNGAQLSAGFFLDLGKDAGGQRLRINCVATLSVRKPAGGDPYFGSDKHFAGVPGINVR